MTSYPCVQELPGYAFALLIFLVTSCRTELPSEDPKPAETALISKSDHVNQLSSHDTIIILSGIVNSFYNGQNLNDSIAKEILYAHFRKQGYLMSEDSLEKTMPTKDENSLLVKFVSIFKTNLNNNQNVDAIINYWLTPPAANGTCLQPHKAIITDTDDGYRISNEDFMPNDYAIDSVSSFNGKPIIFAQEYDCASHRSLRAVRVQLIR